MRTKKMNVRLLKILGIVLLVAGLLTALGVGVGAQASQTWYFTDDVAPDPTFNGTPTVTYHRIMTKGAEGVQGTIVTLAPGERVWFYSDETAVVDVAFPAGEWGVAYWVKALDSGDTGKSVTTRIHSINSAGTRLSDSWGHKGGSEKIKTLGCLEKIEEGALLDTPSFTVPEGGKFAIEVFWTSGAAGDLEIHCNPAEVNVSSVTSPPTDPGYPVPELSTIILFSMGLLLLGGYVWLKRRRACP